MPGQEGSRHPKLQDHGLKVLNAPSKPRCYKEVTRAVGETIVLHCGSQEGAIPTTNLWERTTGSKLLPTSAVMNHAVGRVTIQEACEDDAGTYLCTAVNRVGKFRVLPGTEHTTTYGGGSHCTRIVTGTLLAIGIPCSITYFVVRRLRRSLNLKKPPMT